MPEYRLYYLEGEHICGVTVIFAVSDQAAEAQAAQRLDGRKGELWRGAWKLRIFNCKP